jgi:hypothetical protein
MITTRRQILLGLGSLALLATLPSFPSDVFAAERPEEIVEAIYASYSGNGPSAPPYMQDVATALDDVENHPGFDFFIDAQDFDTVVANVVLASESDTDALVKADVTVFGAQKQVEIDFLKEGGNWKIANVRYPVENGFDLRSALGLSPL